MQRLENDRRVQVPPRPARAVGGSREDGDKSGEGAPVSRVGSFRGIDESECPPAETLSSDAHRTQAGEVDDVYAGVRHVEPSRTGRDLGVRGERVEGCRRYDASARDRGGGGGR